MASVITIPQNRARKSDLVAQIQLGIKKIFFYRPLLLYIKLSDSTWISSTLSRTTAPPKEFARSVGIKITPSIATPLPPRRKRALTLPLPQSIPGIARGFRLHMQKTDDQTMAPFFRLPKELRRLIYEEVLAGGARNRVIHILPKFGRFGHWRCRMQHGHTLCDPEGTQCLAAWLAYKTRIFHRFNAGIFELKTDDGILPFLMTCRAVYSEGIEVLYSRNVFHFYDPGDIRYFERKTLPQRLNSIHSIMLDWGAVFSIFNPDNGEPRHDEREFALWSETWAILLGMESLQEVRVLVMKSEHEISLERRVHMCEPMRKMQGLRVFELVLPFDDDQDWTFAQDAPFKVVREKKRVTNPTEG
ncbi:hypothetical protein PVAG01_08391 [Phlyctema vagabunda]|uniref:DUF7730 domain-containing protein n=1 Tax=Phlyctema vagabunda TaxID=108571 RepID=A0ABR4P9G8_9HELO